MRKKKENRESKISRYSKMSKTDPDIKAIYLISEAMRISTPRMRKANLEFVLSSPKYNMKVK